MVHQVVMGIHKDRARDKDRDKALHHRQYGWALMGNRRDRCRIQ